ncbi:MAG: O-antigen ligase family protein [Acidobacteria bacterium]|nr:O-antigen ligase family protein [Acidobacteriota bacterium]MBI3655267.1 O-antigen ligase family protein [Acidobacteriota bacterium]
MRAFLLFLIMLVAVPISFINSYYGLLIYYWVNYMRPLELAWYIKYFDYGTFLAAALLSGYFLFSIHKARLCINHLGHLLLLWVILGITSATAYIPQVAVWKFWEFSKVIIICILTVSIIKDDTARLKRLMLVIALSSGVLAFHGLKQAIFTGGGMVKGPGGQLAENNDFAIFLTMMIPIIYYVGKCEGNERWRRLCTIMAISSGIAAIFTYSRAGFLELCGVVLIMSAKANRKWVGIIGLSFAVVVFLLFAPQAVKNRIASIKTARQDDISTKSRFDAWECAGRMIRRHPVVGVGPKNFSYVFNYFQSGIPWDTHNGFLRITAESGIPAFIVYVYIILQSIYVLRHTRRKLQKAGGPSHLILYCHGIGAMFPAYIIGNLFNSRHDFDAYYYLIPVIACIRLQADAWLAQNTMTDRQRRMKLFKDRLAGRSVIAPTGATAS